MSKYKALPRVMMNERKWPDNQITKAPDWCSVDLRDGNQALPNPMTIEKKMTMFKLLLDMGFRQIEVGFPSASQIEFDFIRKLIDENLVPDDVFIQVLTQSREQLIRRTVESLKGAKNAIIHLYNSTSPLQRKITFNAGKDEIKKIAVTGTELTKSLAGELKGTNLRFEYSPESFSDTEPGYALEVCEAVIDVWKPTKENKIIMNLPHTVEWFMPNIYADMVEWMSTHFREREKVIISVHTHNDRGTSIAASELACLAGAERVEGTLFGNGERTGNMDIITMALNMFSQGIDPGLDLKNLPHIKDVYEKNTGMEVPVRQPYSGELVFTAFSGSHQDAIKKGMDKRKSNTDPDALWEVPYLPIDPADIGRTYEAIIRINSQSGKGGVAYILSREYGFEIPKLMQVVLGKIVNDFSDECKRELTVEEIYEIFCREYINCAISIKLSADGLRIEENRNDSRITGELQIDGSKTKIEGTGNGPIDAFAHAVMAAGIDGFEVIDFHEQSIESGSGAQAVAYSHIKSGGREFWGAGMDSNISLAGIKSLISAINRSRKG